MNYRERAGRIIISQEEATEAEEKRQSGLQQQARILADHNEGIAQRIETGLGNLKLREKLESANEQVWEGMGRVSEGGKVFLIPDHPSFTKKATLSAHVPDFTPETEPVQRLGIVWIETKQGSSNNDTQTEFGAEGHRSIGMKKIADRIVGAKDVGHDTRLTIEIAIPKSPLKSTDKGKLKIDDTAFNARHNIYTSGWIVNHLLAPSILNSVDLPDLKELGYVVAGGVTRIPGVLSANELFIEFPYEAFDPEIISRLIDGAIIFSSIPRLENPLSSHLMVAESKRMQIMARVGERIPYP